MPEISISDMTPKQPEVPLMIDNETYAVLAASRQDTLLSRHETYHQRALDLSHAFETIGASVEIEREVVHPSSIGSEMAGKLARLRSAENRKIATTESGRLVLVPLVENPDELRGRPALQSRRLMNGSLIGSLALTA